MRASSLVPAIGGRYGENAMYTPAPKSTRILLENARSIAGLRLGHLAEALEWCVPGDLRHHKGWIGRLLEATLGADAGNASTVDFTAIGVELKTIPVDRRGRPRETTFVCSAPLADPDELTWETSRTRNKLEKVLWIPILDGDEFAVGDRLVGSPLLWSPSPEEERLLSEDWREHLDVIRRGRVDEITARDGHVLQIRPKGANADSTTWTVGPDGNAVLTQPRAFYLRTSFTASILARNYAGVG